MKTGLLIPPVVITAGFALAISIIWNQEFRHYIPAGDHSQLALNAPLELEFLTGERPSYIHFFSESCKSSRVNIQHIERIISMYEDKVDFYIINSSSTAGSLIRRKYNVPSQVQIIDDQAGTVGEKLRVKSLPYALITTAAKELYFGGNYNNKNGLCGAGDIIWSSPAIALKFLVEHKQPPLFPAYQLSFIGCGIE